MSFWKNTFAAIGVATVAGLVIHVVAGERAENALKRAMEKCKKEMDEMPTEDMCAPECESVCCGACECVKEEVLTAAPTVENAVQENSEDRKPVESPQVTTADTSEKSCFE